MVIYDMPKITDKDIQYNLPEEQVKEWLIKAQEYLSNLPLGDIVLDEDRRFLDGTI